MNDEQVFRFRVEGIEDNTVSRRRNYIQPFDETYEIEGEHPAHAADRLLHEIEWGILDGYEQWTITFLPQGEAE